MYDVRLWFSKQGRIKYVSHLDMFRLMQRAVRRAQIPVWYTEGFNPRAYISFLQALPLGIECLYEPIDIRLDTEMTYNEVKERLNACMPEGLKIEAVTKPFNKSNEIAYGLYDILFLSEDISAQELKNALSSGELTCEKMGKVKGKKMLKKVNVSASLEEYSVNEEDGKILLRVVLPSGTEVSLNPLHLIDALSAYTGKKLTADNIVRKELLCDDLSRFS